MRLYKYILLFGSLLIASFAFSQNIKVDSLRKAFVTERVDTNRAKTGYRLASYYIHRGLSDSALYFARYSFFISKKQNFKYGMAASSNYLGQTKSYMGYPDSAIYFFKEAKNYFREIKDLGREAGMLNNLGIAYKEQGNIPKALDNYFLALKIKEQMFDSVEIANGYHNIGQLYYDATDTINAIKYHNRALFIRRSISDSSGIASSLIAIGVFHQSKNRSEEAKKCFTESLKISELIKEEESIAIACYNLGNLYYKANKIEESKILYQRSLDLSRKNKNGKGVVLCLEILGSIHLDKNENKKALGLLEEAYSVSREIDATEVLSTLCGKLSAAYEKNGDPGKAVFYLKESIKLKDSLFNAENIRKLTATGLTYEHEKEKLLLQKEQEIEQARVKEATRRKNIIIVVIVVFLGLISGFAYTISKKLKENRRQKKIIEEQKNEMVASINYAKRIQYALLAHDDLLVNNLSAHFVLFKPKDIVSGDFYWATIKNNFFYLSVCDCTGHGVPGAFMSLLNINFLNEAINEKQIVLPGDILNYVRNRIIESMDGGRDGMDALLLKMPLDKKSALVEYAAANNVPLLIRNNAFVPLHKDKMPVGLGENLNPFNTFSFEAIPGDAIYLYTDGFADQFGGLKGKKFMYKQLDNLILSNSNNPILEQKENLLTAFENWKGKLEQVDDICVVGIKF
ncbi:MAG: tetratricopeptide repeat protein [Bacteroidia bacterium]|nr:tetratricopeptide repeat protein [Bacteroidia bacterium]